MTSEAGLLAGPFLSLKKGTRSVPKTSAAKMSLLIFIAEPKSWGFSPIQLSLGKQIWAFPCPWARSGYILGATAFATLAAHLLERSLACASLRHTVVTIPNAIYLYKTTTNIQICSRFFCFIPFLICQIIEFFDKKESIAV